MKLYIEQKVFSWADRFSVSDEFGVPRYFVEGEIFTWGKRLHVYDAFRHEAAYIEQQVPSFLPRYSVFAGGRRIAEIVRQFSFFVPRYSIEELGWEIEGSFLLHDYVITRNGKQVVSIRKEWMTWGDCYELDIASPQDELPALCVVLTIDCVIAQSQ
ncbi:MAG: LURP-one-related family protein [Clostridiales bacterium]|nr:LURP-one-related family protein [Clostridiales bacterium]